MLIFFSASQSGLPALTPGLSTDTGAFSLVLKNLFGARMRIISGYPGGAEIAIETGEVDDRCGWLWSAECQATQTLTSLPTLPSQVNRKRPAFHAW
jgi:hypothetical protein